MLNNVSLRSALIAIACGLSMSSPGQADTPRKVDVPAGEITQALQRLAEQSGVEFVYSPEQLKGVRTNGVHGEYTAEKAVSKLLEGTQLELTIHDSGALLIAAPPAAKSDRSQASAVPVDATARSNVPVGGVRVAQGSPATELHTVLPAMPQSSLEEFQPVVRGIPEMLVKGSKISINADIERTEDDVQPYVVFTAEEIQRSMAVNLEDFLKNRLPMNTASSTQAQNTRSGSNISEINLRGLGVDETLVLINGRRMPGVSNITESDDQNFGQPDINGIPLSSIERIEILPATAAGIYGGGATGGVINIILKTNYTGLEVSANYANTFETDSGIKRISATAGLSLEDGRTTLSASASYSEQNELLVRDRDFTRRSRQLLLRNYPEAFYSNAVQIPNGYTTNIMNSLADCEPPDYVCITRNLVLRDGMVDLGAPITHIPVGYSGDVQQLIANAGSYNLDLANDINNADRSIQNNPRTNSLNFTINREFSDRFSMFVNLARNENKGSVRSAGLFGSADIAADAPNNPFTSDIRVTFPLPGLVFRSQTESEGLAAIVGAAVALPFNWQAQLEGSWGRSRTQYRGGQPILDSDVRDPPFSGPLIRAGAISSIRDGTLDVLQDLNQHPLDLSAFTLPYPNQASDPTDSIGTGGVLRVSGPVFRLPAGAVTLSGLLERRKSEADSTVTQNYIASLGGQSYYFFPSRSTTTDSYYLEAYVPVVSSLNALPWVRSLELQASIRRDDNETHSVLNSAIEIDDPDEVPADIEYTDSSVAATGYTLGLRFAPLRDLALRASFSHGFLPPSISQIGQEIRHTDTEFSFLADPLRNYEIIGNQGDAVIVTNGNPNLMPEESDSISAGLILTPQFLAGLRLSIDYTRIKKTNEIAGVDSDFMIRNPELYPGRVVRGPALDDGLPGPITLVDVSLINIDSTTVEAVDLQLDYSLQTARAGAFNLYAIASKQTEYSRRLTVQSEIQNSVGYFDGPLKWRGNVGLDWRLGALSLGWNMQYFDSYLTYKIGDTTSADFYIAMQGSRKIERQTYHDVSFMYRLEDGWLAGREAFEGVVISGGIQNALNTSPPLITSFTDTGYSSYGDPRLRRYTLQLTKTF